MSAVSQSEIQERKRMEGAIRKWRDEGRLIDVYICPTEGCPSYFGIDSMDDLASEWNHKADTAHGPNDDPFGNPEALRTFTRAECPVCRTQGKQVERVRRVCLVLT